MGKIEKVLTLLNDLQKNEFTGFIRINYSQGGITKIEKNEEILKKVQTQSK
jgi:bisphosphoglycerate-dependent phosphoglycerate mutase